MKLKLRYILVFLMGMACMYWLVRSGSVLVTPMYPRDIMPVPEEIEVIMDTGTVDELGVEIIEEVVDSTTGDLVSTGGAVSGVVATGQEVLDETVSIIQGSDSTESGSTGDVTNTSDVTTSDTKVSACTKPDGNYPNTLAVGWSETLTASTRGYAKRGNFLHYIVNVSNGTKYYFYHNCSDGVAINVQNVTNTDITRVVLENGQVFLR